MNYWASTSGPALLQGDWIRSCQWPVFPKELALGANGDVYDSPVDEGDLIVVTQSCDLENRKARFVALCQIFQLDEFEKLNPEFKRKGEWEKVRKGRREGLHLLASPTEPQNNRGALVVDFGLIISLPIDFLIEHAARSGDRWRLQSPFLEHFSQAFARFFMRVGLPSSIPPYN